MNDDFGEEDPKDPIPNSMMTLVSDNVHPKIQQTKIAVTII